MVTEVVSEAAEVTEVASSQEAVVTEVASEEAEEEEGEEVVEEVDLEGLDSELLPESSLNLMIDSRESIS